MCRALSFVCRRLAVELEPGPSSAWPATANSAVALGAPAMAAPAGDSSHTRNYGPRGSSPRCVLAWRSSSSAARWRMAEWSPELRMKGTGSSI
uniref:Uncharacterized protein n=1 Tax=Arundo donax TaxID=35708 RepID=A0A0A9AKE7_ARUDO